jgi:Ca2+/Na+ antiporter
MMMTSHSAIIKEEAVEVQEDWAMLAVLEPGASMWITILAGVAFIAFFIYFIWWHVKHNRKEDCPTLSLRDIFESFLLALAMTAFVGAIPTLIMEYIWPWLVRLGFWKAAAGLYLLAVATYFLIIYNLRRRLHETMKADRPILYEHEMREGIAESLKFVGNLLLAGLGIILLGWKYVLICAGAILAMTMLNGVATLTSSKSRESVADSQSPEHP